MLVCAILEAGGIGLIMPFIAVIAEPEIIKSNKWLWRINELVGASDANEFLVYLFIGLMAFYGIKNAFLGAMNYLQSRFIFSKRSAFGKKLFQSYMNSPFSFYLERNRSEILRNFYALGQVYGFVLNLLILCANVFVVTCIVIMLLLVDPVIVICSIAIIGGASGVIYKGLSGYSVIVGKQVQSSQKHVGQVILEGFGAIKEVKILGKEKFFPNRYYTHMMEYARANWRQATINIVPRLLLEVVAVGSVVLIVFLFHIQGKEIKVLLPTLGLFAMAIIRLIPSISQIVRSMQQFRFFSPAVDIIYEEMQLLGKLKPDRSYVNRHSDNLLGLENEISVRNHSYIYPNSKEKALHGVTFNINRGQSIAFVGASGSGKTTLANLLIGLLEPSEGSIFVDRYDIFQNLSAWHRNIGYVPQAVYLLDASVRSNVAFGLSEHEIGDTEVWEALKLAQLEGFVKQLPRGLDTFVGENGVRLSGGQRQRLGIARAIFHKPEILILDEATSALDNETEMEVSQAIEALSGHKTLIIIAHRLSTIQKCNRIYYMEKGAIVGSGTFEELLSTSEEFKTMSEIGKY